MRTRWLAWLASMVCGGGVHAVDMQLGPQTRVVFASADEGRAVVGARDEFVARLSAFDRSARLHTDQEVSEEEFLRYAAASVAGWTDAEQARVAAAWALLRPRLEPLGLTFPAEIRLIATSGAEEGGAAYTRGVSILLPPADRAKTPDQIAGLLAHELFHVLSRHDPALREKCYVSIGFRRCGELTVPGEWRDRKITNPDAPFLDYYINVSIAGQTTSAIPVLLARADRYDVARGGEFFDYLQVKFLPVEPAPPGQATLPLPARGDSTLVDFNAATDFFDQVGQNTEYIIHPEEILAENFRLLLFDAPNLPSPEVVTNLRRILHEHRADARG